MDGKQRILELLERSRGEFISGEQMAARLKVSRNMVWRAINALRADGHQIEAVTNKGYRLEGRDDKLSLPGIRAHLWDPGLAEGIRLHTQVASTNTLGKEQALAGAPHGTVILAESQSAGRGRYRRSFYSPAGGGLYMSFVLDPERVGFATPTAITAYAAVCVCEAVEGACGVSPGVKWVNDILLEGKKVGGILTEAVTDFESGEIHNLVLGIGLNVSTRAEDFPEELAEIAASLDPEGKRGLTRNRLAAELINRVLGREAVGEEELFRRYRDRLVMLGRTVTVMGRGEPYAARALDIDSTGQLIVETAEGERRVLNSGEIRVTF